MKKNIVAPSILSADFAHLAADIHMLNESAAEWIHIDVMDGVFVPNISFGFPVLRAVRNLTKKICDVHLMIVQPERYIENFRQAGADIITVHYEGNYHLDSLITKIKSFEAQAGVALNPSTPVSVLKEVIHLLDVVLIMSVNPGFGGQSFIPYTIEKVAEAKELISLRNSKAQIEVDGGVTLENAPLLTAAGANVLVAGNTVFSASNPLEIIERLAKA
jgi:ribulose-phosphate 3-epimerase